MEREPSWLCISDQVINGVNPKWGVIMVYVEILFINLLFMPPPPRFACSPIGGEAGGGVGEGVAGTMSQTISVLYSMVNGSGSPA
jgi:hypothetical protein